MHLCKKNRDDYEEKKESTFIGQKPFSRVLGCPIYKQLMIKEFKICSTL